MLDFILSILLLIICCIIGNVVGNLLANYFISKSLKNNLFSKSDFIDIDDDFFSDSTESSITDIPTHIESNSNELDPNENISKPNFF